MPHTNVFSGSSSSSTSYGGIGIEGNGDATVVTFKDKKYNQTQAEIKVYALSELKKLQSIKTPRKKLRQRFWLTNGFVSALKTQ